MENELYIPLLNPLKWVSVNANQNNRYFTKFRDDWQFEKTQYEFEEYRRLFQPWIQGDPLVDQFESNFAPIQIDIRDPLGNIVVAPFNCTQVRANKYMPGFYIYEMNIDTTDIPPGVYQGYMIPGGSDDDAQMTEWFCIGTDSKNTVLIEYYNNRFHGDVVFETGIVFSLRLPGFFQEKEPQSLDVVYDDQDLDGVQLSSKPSAAYTWFVGDGGGIPPWMAERANWAISCSNTVFDGKLMAKVTGAQWKKYDQEDLHLSGYSIDMRPGLNRSSRIVNPTSDPNKKITLVYNIDQSVLFGSMAPTGGTITFPVTSVE